MKNVLNKNPMYVQLANILRELIDSDEYQAGDKFLTEREIAVQYGVSRATSNKALAVLVSGGVLDFKKGVGTFVAAKSTNQVDSMMISHLRSASMSGQNKFQSHTLEVKCINADILQPEVLKYLDIESSTELYFVSILRMIDKDPAILDYRYIVKSRCLGEVYSEENPCFFDWGSVPISSYDERCKIIYLSEKESSLLEVKPHEPAFLVNSIGSDQNGVPLWWGQTYMKQNGEYALELHVDFSENIPGGYGKLSFGV